MHETPWVSIGILDPRETFKFTPFYGLMRILSLIVIIPKRSFFCLFLSSCSVLFLIIHFSKTTIHIIHRLIHSVKLNQVEPKMYIFRPYMFNLPLVFRVDCSAPIPGRSKCLSIPKDWVLKKVLKKVLRKPVILREIPCPSANLLIRRIR